MEFIRNTCYTEAGGVEMIIKQRERPAKIAGYEALLARLPAKHPKREYILDLLYSANAGIGGEERLDECLEYFDPPYPYVMIHDLSLPEKCQIDTLLITQSSITVLEVKNMSGKLCLKTNPSVLHQTLPSGQVKSYKSPVIQAETAKIKVEKILKRHACPLNVKTAIVLAYPSQMIENVPPGATVWSADEVMYRLYRMEEPKPLISIGQMNSLGELLLSIDRSHKPFPLAPNLKINPNEIENGVFCPRCRLRKMKRQIQRWHCPTCNFYSRDEYLRALDQWFMLYKSTINAKECMQFLGLRDTGSARRMLKSKGLEEMGGRRHRYYQLKRNHQWQ